MGDRGNIFIVTDKRTQGKKALPIGVVFYSHWGGSSLAKVVHKALSKRWRWSDESYLARIVFDAMTDGNAGGETGFGISLQAAGDAQHPIVWVEPPTYDSPKMPGYVSFRPNSYNHANPKGDPPDPYKGCRWTFDQFIKMSESEVDEIFNKID